MIVKKVKNPQKSSGKARRIGRLVDYVQEPEQRHEEERCTYFEGREFITDDLRSRVAEMIALSEEAVRSKDTVNHYVLSWQQDERPNPAQIEQAVSLFMEDLGVEGHQVFYGLHTNTDNAHLHVVVNRVHPETLKCVQINKGFDIEAAHRAICRIEHVQGWRQEQNARYRMLEDGRFVRREVAQNRQRQPDQPKRDREYRTGEKSAERIAIEGAAPIVQQAQSWEQLHRELAEKGMRYQRKGSGAVIFVGEVAVKASSVAREASFGKLQKRLGAYEPPRQERVVVERQPEPMQAETPEWRQYVTGRKQYEAARDAAKLVQEQRQQRERQQLAKRQQARRGELLKGNWQGKGALLNALRSAIADEQKQERKGLEQKHQAERQQHRQKFQPYPELERWQQMQMQMQRQVEKVRQKRGPSLGL